MRFFEKLFKQKIVKEDKIETVNFEKNHNTVENTITTPETVTKTSQKTSFSLRDPDPTDNISLLIKVQPNEIQNNSEREALMRYQEIYRKQNNEDRRLSELRNEISKMIQEKSPHNSEYNIKLNNLKKEAQKSANMNSSFFHMLSDMENTDVALRTVLAKEKRKAAERKRRNGSIGAAKLLEESASKIEADLSKK